eukprot:5934740-Pyramimonas_sp.AAC.1
MAASSTSISAGPVLAEPRQPFARSARVRSCLPRARPRSAQTPSPSLSLIHISEPTRPEPI